ncbi:MAG TPA: AAA family ATPase [Magnetospirillum sp.]|nr:AAA family ATPase [Magnetospirillum sp.]
MERRLSLAERAAQAGRAKAALSRPSRELPNDAAAQRRLKQPDRRALDLESAHVLVAGDTAQSVHCPAALVEELRIIKRQLLATAFPDRVSRSLGNSNVIVITSPSAGEGKSFVALNLALSMSSELDREVLLIDADAGGHALANHLHHAGRPGLIDVLAEGHDDAAHAILPTAVPRLSFLPPGRAHPHAAELLASRHMAQVITRLSLAYANGIIIIDTPAVLHSIQAVSLSACAGQTVVVVEKDRTTRRALKRTLSLLEGCENLSCILNMASAERDTSEYGNH